MVGLPERERDARFSAGTALRAPIRPSRPLWHDSGGVAPELHCGVPRWDGRSRSQPRNL